MLVALQGAVSQGILWGIMVLGVFITFRLLDIADMTCDGSFALGGSVVAVLVVNAGVDPAVAILAGMLAGAVAGAVTGLLTTVFEIPAILAGILTQISLWSINLRIMGKSNTPLLSSPTIFSRIADATGLPQSTVTMIVGAILVALIVLALYWFFGTDLGSGIRATGANPNMSRAQGINVNRNKVLGLMISNGIVALSSALYSQYQGFADVNAGRGAIVIGLAAVIIGDVIFSRIFQNFALKLVSVSLGAVIYYVVIQIVLTLGLDSNDLKLFSALVVAIFLAVPYWKNRYFRSKPKAVPAGKKEGVPHA